MRIVLPMARHGWHDASADVIACQLVGVPQGVAGIGKAVGKRGDGGVQSLALEHLHKGEVHIDIVVERGYVVEEILEVTVGVFNDATVGNHDTAILELGGTAIGATDGLACPSAGNLVLQHRLLHSDSLGLRRASGLPSSKVCKCSSFSVFFMIIIDFGAKLFQKGKQIVIKKVEKKLFVGK